MLPGELQAKYANDPRFQAYRNWSQSGSPANWWAGYVGRPELQGIPMRNPSAQIARTDLMDWGETKDYDAQGQEVTNSVNPAWLAKIQELRAAGVMPGQGQGGDQGTGGGAGGTQPAGAPATPYVPAPPSLPPLPNLGGSGAVSGVGMAAKAPVPEPSYGLLAQASPQGPQSMAINEPSIQSLLGRARRQTRRDPFERLS